MIHLLVAMRPKQWVKNLLVFAVPLAAGKVADAEVMTAAVVAFVLGMIFASVASGLDEYFSSWSVGQVLVSILVVIVAVAGAFFSYRSIAPKFRARNRVEGMMLVGAITAFIIVAAQSHQGPDPEHASMGCCNTLLADFPAESIASFSKCNIPSKEVCVVTLPLCRFRSAS